MSFWLELDVIGLSDDAAVVPSTKRVYLPDLPVLHSKRAIAIAGMRLRGPHDKVIGELVFAIDAPRSYVGSLLIYPTQ